MNRDCISSLDYVRAFAIAMVVASHWGQGLGVGACGVLGGIANCLFFVLSGLCLGIQWHSAGCPKYGIVFLRKRVARIYVPFVAFLGVYCIVLISFNGREGVMGNSVALNFLMLSWFAKLPGIGHLWFVTGMVMNYFVILGVSRNGNFLRKHALISILAALFVCVTGQIILSYCGVDQGYFLSMLLMSALAFAYGNRMMSCFVAQGRCRIWVLVVAGCFCVISMLGIALNWRMMSAERTVFYWWCMLVAIVLIVFLASLKIRRTVSPISFICAISYEVYLVHNPLCTPSPLFLKRLINNDFVYTVVFLSLSVMLGFALKRVIKSRVFDVVQKYRLLHPLGHKQPSDN